MTSRRPCWCPKTIKRRPCWCPKPVLWEYVELFSYANAFFCPINLHRCWPREWKHSIEILKYIWGAFHWDHLNQDQWSEITQISRSNEAITCSQWIHRFIWSTMIRVIWLDHLKGTHPQIFMGSSTGPVLPSFHSPPSPPPSSSPFIRELKQRR